MSTANIKIGFDGDAVKDGTMDVSLLGSCLISFGETLRESARVLNGDDCNFQVKLKGGFKSGSFEFDLSFIQGIIEQAVNLFGKKQYSPQEIATLVGYLGAGALGATPTVIEFVKWLKNRKVLKQEPLENGITKITTEDGDTIETKSEVIQIAKNRTVRLSLRKALSPLDRPDYEIAYFESKEININKKDVQKFDVPEPIANQKPIREDVFLRKAWCSLSNISFDTENKWKIDDGDNKFYVKIEDQSLIDSIEQGARLGKFDRFLFEIETKQVLNQEKTETTHTIKRVLGHEKSQVQAEFLF